MTHFLVAGRSNATNAPSRFLQFAVPSIGSVPGAGRLHGRNATPRPTASTTSWGLIGAGSTRWRRHSTSSRSRRRRRPSGSIGHGMPSTGLVATTCWAQFNREGYRRLRLPGLIDESLLHIQIGYSRLRAAVLSGIVSPRSGGTRGRLFRSIFMKAVRVTLRPAKSGQPGAVPRSRLVGKTARPRCCRPLPDPAILVGISPRNVHSVCSESKHWP